ncbi:MAG: hypothetical protein Q8N77_06530 [Nanoarchaeota archaeon]|nr:hypothetical protein [Nanoarchaeota archaeon]
MVVTLTSPADGLIINNTGGSIIFQCKVSYTIGEENITSLSLYTNFPGFWSSSGSNSTAVDPNTDISFSISTADKANQTYEWNCLAEALEGDPVWAASNFTFNLSEEPVPPSAPNNNPTCTLSSSINKTTNEDTGVDIDSNLGSGSDSGNTISCSDPDSDALTFSIHSQSGSGTYSLSNSNLSVIGNANATGGALATIKVQDARGAIIYFDLSTTFTAVNDPPLASVIPNQNWDQDKNKTIALSEYFSDVDDSSLNYSYAFNSSSPHISAVIKDGGDAVLTPENSWYGSEAITFTAYDSANLSFTSNEVILAVGASNATSNNPPNIDTYSPLSNPTISVGESQTFSITKSDSDGDSMNVTWYVDNVVQEGKTGNSFVYTASIVGSFTVKVAVSDGSLSDTNTWVLTVKSAGITTNKTAQPGEEEVGNKTLACGDGVCAEGEDQFSCCKDCGCPEGYDCYEPTGKCRKETKSQNTILLIIVASVFLGGAGVGLYIYKKKQNEEIFGNLANIPFKLPPKEGGVEVKEEVKFQKPTGAVVKKVEEKQKTAAVEKPLKKAKSSSQVLLKNYVIQNLKKGKTWEQLKVELRSVGWTDEQIDEAYTAAQLDEAFS